MNAMRDFLNFIGHAVANYFDKLLAVLLGKRQKAQGVP